MFWGILEDEAGDSAAGAGEEDGFAFFGLAADVEAGGGQKGPGHAVVGGEVDAGGAAAEDVVAADVFDASAVAVRGLGGCDPCMAAVVGEEAVLGGIGVVCKVAPGHDEVLASVEGVMIFDGDGVGAGGGGALDDGQVDSFIADKDAGMGAAADEADGLSVQCAYVGAAGGEASFAGVGYRQFLAGNLVPAVAAVEAACYEKAAVDGVAYYDAALAVPEFHGVEEHSWGIVLIDEFPVLAAVDGFEDMRGRVDGDDDGGPGIECFDIAKVSFIVTGYSHPGPGIAAVGGAANGSLCAADPNDLIVYGAESAYGYFGASGKHFYFGSEAIGARGCGAVEASGCGAVGAVAGGAVEVSGCGALRRGGDVA